MCDTNYTAMSVYGADWMGRFVRSPSPPSPKVSVLAGHGIQTTNTGRLGARELVATRGHQYDTTTADDKTASSG